MGAAPEAVAVAVAVAVDGFQLILKVLLLPGPVILPMERAIQVGTSLELWFSRNIIFPVFAVIQKKTICRHTTSPPKSSAKVGSSINFESSLASRSDSATNAVVRTSWNSIGALDLEK